MFRKRRGGVSRPMRGHRMALAAFAAAAVQVLAGCAQTAAGDGAGSTAPAQVELPVAFALKRDAEGLFSAAMERATPAGPKFRQWLSGEQIADAYGAPADDAARVLAEARKAGFVGTLDPTRGVISGSMTAAEAE